MKRSNLLCLALALGCLIGASGCRGFRALTISSSVGTGPTLSLSVGILAGPETNQAQARP